MFATRLGHLKFQKTCISVNVRCAIAIKNIPRLQKKTALRLKAKRTSVDVDWKASNAESLQPMEDQPADFPGDLSQTHHLWIPLLSLLGFATVAGLVFAMGPESPVLRLDYAVHDWVVSNIPATISDAFFNKTVSNLFIEFDLVVGTFLMLIDWMGTQNRSQNQFALIGLGCLFFYAGVGSHKYEGMLVYAIKRCFHRLRPQSGFISYAFPSGHVTSAVFLTAALFYIVLPATLQSLNAKTHPTIQSLVSKLDRNVNKSVFCGLSFMFTAIGRVGGNVHWVSDTIAGCLLGIALASIFNSLHTLIRRTQRL